MMCNTTTNNAMLSSIVISNIVIGKIKIIMKSFLMILSVCWLTSCGMQDKAFVLHKGDVVETAAENVVPVPQSDDESALFEQTAIEVTSEEQMILVYVCGAVKSPGVVELPKESRAADALEAAGGLLAEAQPDYVNLAAKLEDAQRLYFPTKEEALLLLQKEAVETNGLININTAGVELLCTLPGIGQAKAADIVNYREAHGAFQSKEELMKVSGIKQSAYDKLCDKISVD